MEAVAIVAIAAIAAAAVVALAGVVAPTVRAVAREGAVRARAEERAELAAHVHDVVLQELALIQRRAEDPDQVRRLARHTERGLRAWLRGAARRGDDLVGALVAAVEDVEDRFAVQVELVTSGSCPLDRRTEAVVGAAQEALTNAAKHAGVRRMSLFAEASDVEVFVLVRDRGRGFDQAAGVGRDRHGVANSIVRRMQRHGGTALIRSEPDRGTEVELRIPLRVSVVR
ncbi:MAG TPA: ATP-binding protein [Acidimicrobiales bacterium]|nr:ATP-binding protein [Acidimicrobiales bacterium]